MNPELIEAKKEIEEKLKFFKDPNFNFYEKEHIYTYNNVKYESVTTFLKKFKEPYDKTYWSSVKAAERGITQKEILNEWQRKADIANDLGTRVHKWIEDFWSGLAPKIPDDDIIMNDRINKFIDIYNRKLNVLLPLESELKIFSKRWKLAGTIDQPFLLWMKEYNKPFLIIGDWKTNENFKHDNHPKGKYKKLLRPFSHLYENHHNEYSIQISLYRLILEEIGIETHDGFLCHIGPNSPAKLYKILDLRNILKSYLDQNREDYNIFSI